jgi:hypothetical protein
MTSYYHIKPYLILTPFPDESLNPNLYLNFENHILPPPIKGGDLR